MKNETKRTPAIAAHISQDTPDSGYTPNDALELEFANGERLVLQISDLSPSVIGYAIMHGLKQKLVDAAAISRNPDTGRAASIDDKYQAVKTVYDRLLAGQWNAERGEGGTGTGGLLFRALVIMYEGKRTPEWIREFLAGKSKAEQAALRANPKVAAVIDELRAADSRESVDTDGMLEALEGGDED